MDLGLKGKVAIVTGSSNGIGAGIAKVLAQEGCNIVINYFNSESKAQKVVEEIKQYGVDVIAIKADVGNEADCIKMFEETINHFKTVDILVNNAGSTKREKKAIDEFDLAAFRERSSVYVEGTMVCSREFVKIAKLQNKPASIVNVLSKSLYWSSSINNTTYATCKGADWGFTRALAHEVAQYGIRVNAIIPGYVINSNYNPDSPRFKKVVVKIPSGEYATPEDMGNTVAYLVSDKARQIYGHCVDCTGGTMLGDVPDSI